MTDAEKTVFISYRRSASKHLARTIFMDLRQHGYDVFLDVNTIDSGVFDSIILNQIAARVHFVVLLSPGALERCANEGDWLRREIEEALWLKRNIVPVIEEGFDFEKEMGYLPEAWRGEFKRLSGMRLLHDYFEAGMEKLRNRFLKQPVYTVEIRRTPVEERAEVERRVEEAENDEMLTDRLRSHLHFGRGVMKKEMGDYDNVIAEFSKAISFNPTNKLAYYERGYTWRLKGNRNDAIADFTEAIRLDPYFADAYYERGQTRNFGDFKEAIADYTQVISLDPNHVNAYIERAHLYKDHGNFDEAIADYSQVLRLKTDDVYVYRDRGLMRKAKGDYFGAISDFNQVMILDPEMPYMHYYSALAREALLDYHGALEDYQKYLDFDLHTGFVEDAEERILELKAQLQK